MKLIKEHGNNGKKQSLETIKKRVETRRGYRHSEETKKKIGNANRGKISCNKGKQMSEEQKKKIGNANRGKKKPPYTEEYKRKQSEAHKGEKSYLWRGGVTPLLHMIRTCFKYRQWRSDIFTRDNYTCIWCGAKNGNGKRVCLEADHYPKMFSIIFYDNKISNLEEALSCEEFWNINNGRTLCRECHDKTKTKRNKI